ncbi:MAG: hypothetical protein JSW07_05900, partial [bacterium]
MFRKILTFNFIFIILLTLTASAQTLDDILKQYYEARGGYEKVKSVKSMKTTGKQMVQGMEIPFTIQQKRPNL